MDIASITQERSRARLFSPRALSLFFLALGGLLGLLGALICSWPPPITASDVNQQRANTVLPAPQGDVGIEQSFTATRDGLYEVELLLARPPDAGDGELRLTLLDEVQRPVASQTLNTGALEHNQLYRLHFRPQPHSAGERYTLLLAGDERNPVSVWGYDLDVYAGGAVRAHGAETAARDLRIVTRYQLSAPAALRILSDLILENGALLLLALAFVTLPGALVLLLATRGARPWDVAAWWGAAVAISTATWPIIWSWMTLVGGRFSGVLLWAVFVLGWLVVVIVWRWRVPGGGWHGWRGRFPLRRAWTATASKRATARAAEAAPTKHVTLSLHHPVTLSLLLLGLAVRLLAVRDLVFPPWVDSSRHALITQVMAQQGQLLTSYEPFWPADRLPYHYGFHTLSASLLLMSDAALPQLLLVMGQLFNALIPLSVYAAAWLFGRRRDMSLLAAFLVALPFFFPAYYATWGRFTQLAGMLVLPLLLALTWQVVRGARTWRRLWWLVGVLATGLFLVHFRVFLIYLPFAALVVVLSLGRHWRWLAGAALLSQLLAAPRLILLLRETEPGNFIQSTIPNYNVFPAGYLAAGWERPFFILAGLSLFISLIALILRRRWATLPLALGAWVGLLFLLLSGRQLRLPETSLINLNSMYITLFLPVALVIALTVGRIAGSSPKDALRAREWGVGSRGVVRAVVVGAALVGAALFGVKQQIGILNPETVLAWPQDAAGLAWVGEHLPPDARVAVNSWQWLGNTWAGSDGGAWLTPLTALDGTTPPVDYIYNNELARSVSRFNEAATAVEDWSTPEAAALLREHGVSHIFIGARGGFFDPAALARNPELRLLYANDGVFLFALNGS